MQFKQCDILISWKVEGSREGEEEGEGEGSNVLAIHLQRWKTSRQIFSPRINIPKFATTYHLMKKMRIRIEGSNDKFPKC